MKQVNLVISNQSSTTLIEEKSFSFEGKDLKQAVGLALVEAHRSLNKQYDAPVVNIEGVELTSTEIKKLMKSYMDFQIEFALLRESILAQLAFTSEEAKTDYIRSTDLNGVFKNTKSFTTEQLAAQAKERLRLTRDVTRWIKEDAKSSVVPPEVAERRAALQSAAQAKRIAAKSVGK